MALLYLPTMGARRQTTHEASRGTAFQGSGRTSHRGVHPARLATSRRIQSKDDTYQVSGGLQAILTPVSTTITFKMQLSLRERSVESKVDGLIQLNFKSHLE